MKVEEHCTQIGSNDFHFPNWDEDVVDENVVAEAEAAVATYMILKGILLVQDETAVEVEEAHCNTSGAVGADVEAVDVEDGGEVGARVEVGGTEEVVRDVNCYWAGEANVNVLKRNSNAERAREEGDAQAANAGGNAGVANVENESAMGDGYRKGVVVEVEEEDVEVLSVGVVRGDDADDVAEVDGGVDTHSRSSSPGAAGDDTCISGLKA